MISKAIRDNAEKLTQINAKRVSDAADYLLDYSWPSIGIIDRALFWLNGRENLLAKEDAVVRAVSCYVAVMIYDLWEAFSGDLVADIDSSGVFVRLSRGPYLKSDGYLRINIEIELRRIITGKIPEIPVIGDFERVVGFNYNRMSLFLIGVFIGQSPLIDGSWASDEPSFLDKPSATIVTRLAQQSADHYRVRFPDESLGADPELYLRGQMISPPTLMQEKTPAYESAAAVVNYLSTRGISNAEQLLLLENLSTFADERISLTGFVGYLAINNQPSERIVYVGEMLSMFTSLLRRSVIEVRRDLGAANPDWLFADAFVRESEDYFFSERLVGCFPFLKLAASYISKVFAKDEYREIIALVVGQELQEVSRKLQKLVEVEPKLFELRLQLLWLESLSGEHAKIERAVRGLLSEPGAETIPGIYELGGRVATLQGNLKQAVSFYQKAYGYCFPTQEEYPEHGLNYAHVLSATGSHEEAYRILVELKSSGERPGAYWGLRVALANELKQVADAEKSSEMLRYISPYHPGIMREIWFPHIMPQ